MTVIGRKYRVLVVEDNHDSAAMLSQFLRMTGYDVEEVHTGIQALQAAEQFRPDCVLSDIGLPGLSGYDVAKLFKSHAFLRDVPLVALSAYGDPDKTHEAGFDHHLVKPAELGALVQVLADVCGRAKRSDAKPE